MIRGMSYNKGVFFMNKKGISHATYKNGQIETFYEKLSLKAFLFMFWRLILSTPWYLYCMLFLLFLIISWHDLHLDQIFTWQMPSVPLYTVILIVFGYHFYFPKQLKKYHGAEHKVFSYKGRRHIAHLRQIQQASIVNRYCSTNAVVLFFFFFIVSFPFLGGWIATIIGLIGMGLVPRFWKWGDLHIFFPISSYLQKKFTTAEPEEQHLRVAILSYMSLMAEKSLTEEEVWKRYQEELEELRKIQDEKCTTEQSTQIT